MLGCLTFAVSEDVRKRSEWLLPSKKLRIIRYVIGGCPAGQLRQDQHTPRAQEPISPGPDHFSTHARAYEGLAVYNCMYML